MASPAPREKQNVPAKRATRSASTAATANQNNSTHDNEKTTKNLRTLSHSLSWALRHKALDLGWTMTPDGFVPVDEILHCRHAKFRGYSLEDIRQVVETNDKQRYKLEERPAASYSQSTILRQQQARKLDDGTKAITILCIRANQGHTISSVDPELLLERLDPKELKTIPVIVHGTFWDAWQSIQQQGLSRMKRTHIHFASGLPKDDGVISGMRKSCQIYIYVDAAKCARDGVVFYRSDNGVLLTAGLQNEGTLQPMYFLRVTDSSGKILLSNESTS